MKVALLGAGRIGALHARILNEHPDVESLVVGDVDDARAEELAAQLGGRAGSLDEVLEGGVSAAVITAATSAHADLIHSCLDAGLPTFCEKPVADTLERTLEVVERVEREHATVQIGFQRRFDAAHRAARELVESGRLGTLFSLRLATHDPDPPHEDYIASSGGIFRDLHIHDFDSLRWLTGSEPAEVFALGDVREYEVFARYGDFDTTAAVLRMESGALAVLTGARRDPLGYDVRVELFGSDDSVAVGLDRGTPLRPLEPSAEGLIPGPHHRHFTERFDAAYRSELAHFLDLARGRAANPCGVRDALESMRVAIAADRSAAEGRPVSPREIETA